MLILCGFAVSNYFNKVKLALLEKGVPFTEELVHPRHKPADLYDCSPLGKVPYLKTPHGTLSESQVILEYIEQTHPTPALLPADPWQAAKVRELTTYLDWHVEMTARDLYGTAFFGGEPMSERNKERVHTQLVKNLRAFKALAKFAPFVAGDQFTQADCAAFANLPLVSMATKIVYGTDLLVDQGIDAKNYLRLIGERPSAQRVTADRKAYQAAQQASNPA
ncbi:MAG: glutathione S-transferase family protein [Betaproteobacteria bacterium]|nr:glutathione S-transferase [Betaproteobacteria bacterium]MDE2047281.1 glutathione S-transferase family protein [Betaproteobacteria bacterium]